MSDRTSRGGRLWVVATPIGNLEDITLRALRILREADCILAEDTRRTRILCQHYGIATPLRAYHAHSAEKERRGWLERLELGDTLALVSDAGTPLVSDPGADLVSEARGRGISVQAAPGPSAALAALCVSGLRAERFRFVGFVPRSGARRRDALHGIARAEEAQVLFASPRRIGALLQELALLLGDRTVAVCRELTKIHEEVVRGTASELAARFAEGARGEITLVVEARSASTVAVSDEEMERWVRARLEEGMRPKEIARGLAAWAGLRGQDAYARVLQLQ